MTTDVVPLTIVREQSPARVWQRRGGSLLAHTLLIIASILMLYPLLWMLSASFRPENEIFSSSSLIPSTIDLKGYVTGWFGLSTLR